MIRSQRVNMPTCHRKLKGLQSTHKPAVVSPWLNGNMFGSLAIWAACTALVAGSNTPAAAFATRGGRGAAGRPRFLRLGTSTLAVPAPRVPRPTIGSERWMSRMKCSTASSSCPDTANSVAARDLPFCDRPRGVSCSCVGNARAHAACTLSTTACWKLTSDDCENWMPRRCCGPNCDEGGRCGGAAWVWTFAKGNEAA